jgi:hypothetical protein
MKPLNMDICNICKKEFKNTEEYLNHTCSTGFKPTQIEHAIKIDPNYKAISEAALARGKANS